MSIQSDVRRILFDGTTSKLRIVSLSGLISVTLEDCIKRYPKNHRLELMRISLTAKRCEDKHLVMEKPSKLLLMMLTPMQHSVGSTTSGCNSTLPFVPSNCEPSFQQSTHTPSFLATQTSSTEKIKKIIFLVAKTRHLCMFTYLLQSQIKVKKKINPFLKGNESKLLGTIECLLR